MKHQFWRPDEDGCPSDIKASNGELHTIRCKVCGGDGRGEVCEMSSKADGLDEIVVAMGTHQVVRLDKLYGPLVACDLRIFVDGAAGEWVIEREHIDKDNVQTWAEIARFDCQESIHFDDEDPNGKP